MDAPIRRVLADATVLAGLQQSWLDSAPGTSGGHEEGGFIVVQPTGDLDVVRWGRGEDNCIIVPPHANCQVGNMEIVASFHTHPNTGTDFIQEPSETDKRAVRDDPDLKGSGYVGEIVVSEQKIYQITTSGDVQELGNTQQLFEGAESWQL